MTTFCNKVFLLILYLLIVFFSFKTMAGMTKNRLRIHFQRQQSRILLTYVSHGRGYTLIYLVHLFLKTNCTKETRKNNSARDA